MILKLKSGDTVVIANAWSAGADGDGLVMVTAHGGTIGLTITMAEFEKEIDVVAQSMGATQGVDLTKFCEDPKTTMARLYQQSRPKA